MERIAVAEFILRILKVGELDLYKGIKLFEVLILPRILPQDTLRNDLSQVGAVDPLNSEIFQRLRHEGIIYSQGTLGRKEIFMCSHQQRQPSGVGAVSHETQEFKILVELLHISF